jgi:F-type H+-transporting ATPase subunit epsilon
MKSFALEIRNPEKVLLMERVTSLTVPAGDGSLGVLADHAPLAVSLTAGQVAYHLEEGGQEAITGKGGFLIIKNNQASILLAQ